MYIDTRMLRTWWLLISFNSEKTDKPTQVANDAQAPNCAVPISM